MRAASAFAAALLFFFVASSADAYPQFQLVFGAKRCNECHYSPAGGGLLNDYGRDESAEDVSRGGDGAFLHGVWEPPSWLALGGDFRGAAVAGTRDVAAFPMQVDLYARAAIGPVSLNVNAGPRGAARFEDLDGTSLIVSREHYLMWRPSTTGVYLRAGRFFAPYGLRLAEHTLFSRRYLGFDTLEEPYGVSGGYLTDGWEAHATGFTADPLRPPIGDDGSGGAGMIEVRFGDGAAVGAQGKSTTSDERRRIMGGLTGKLLVPGTQILLLAQADLGREHLKGVMDPFADRDQVSFLLGTSWMFLRGYMVDLFLEHWSFDLDHTRNDRDGAIVQAHWFPFAHLEVALTGELDTLGRGDGGATTGYGLVQLHYYP